MTNLLITISGSGGGNQGPLGIYKNFESSTTDTFQVINMDTLKDKIGDNVARVVDVVTKNLEKYKNIYLMGYSMGGAVVALATYQLNSEDRSPIKGIVFLATQTEGLQYLMGINVPVLFFHGTDDEYFPLWQLQSTFKRYKSEKQMVVIKGASHSFRPEKNHSTDTQKLAKDIWEHSIDFFSEKKMNSSNQTEKALPLQNKQSTTWSLRRFFGSLF